LGFVSFENEKVQVVSIVIKAKQDKSIRIYRVLDCDMNEIKLDQNKQ
jgi:hypothetical protein